MEPRKPNEAQRPYEETSHQSIPPSARSKFEIKINVYDLLPSGSLSSILWHLGSSLLHTGVFIPFLDREYAFGGHNQPDTSGVYWTKPRNLPPGGIWRCELLHGLSFKTIDEIEDIIQEAGGLFLGMNYNLLNNNCNHFTNYLCERLVGKAAPGWLNRAASIGIALPCVVPKEWVAPPDVETMDGELVGEVEEDDGDERTSMLRLEYQRASDAFRENSSGSGTDERIGNIQGMRNHGENWKGKGVLRDPE